MYRSTLAITGAVLVVTLTVVATWRNSESPVALTYATPQRSIGHDTRTSAETATWNESTGGPSFTAGSNAASVWHHKAITPVMLESPPTAPDSPPPRPASPARRPGWAPRTSGTHVDYLTDALFRQLDTNRDGVLTGTEIPTAFRGEVNERGVLDFETFAKLFHEHVQKVRSGQIAATASNAGALGLTGTLPGWFTSLDPEGTGRVKLSRWRTAGRSVTQFQRMDTDGDGVLTWREVRAYQALPGTSAPARQAASGTSQPSQIANGRSAGTEPDPKPEFGEQPSTNSTKQAAVPTRADVLLAYYGAVAAEAPPKTRTPGAATTAGVARPAPTSAPAPPAPPAPPSQPPAPPPEGEIATLPLPLTGNSYWVYRDTGNQMELSEGARANVLFLGDSITDFLQNASGAPLWAEYFAPFGALDFAIGGIRTSHVLWQVETGQVAQTKPKLIVLLIGSNNLGIAGHKPEEVAAGIEKIVTELGVQLPKTRILLLGLLPRGAAPNDPFRAKIAKVNNLISDLHDGDRVTYLDIGSVFVAKDGTIPAEIMPDGAHPSLLGYGLYTGEMWPTMVELLKRK